jgi:uncharacterized protein (DUF1684 family)
MPETLDAEAWEAAVLRLRAQKDEYFAADPHSPMPADQRGEDFPGLSYFAYEQAYRAVVAIQDDSKQAQITVETTADGEQHYQRAGAFTFTIPPGEITLTAFAPTDGADRLWLPFRDETSGETTYGAGRYLDLRPDEHQLEDERWIVDLNLAYNPTCAYNPAYECPLVPTENWLQVPVKAGERAYQPG